MQEVIQDLTKQSTTYENAAKEYRQKGNHIPATRFYKLARHYRTAAKLLSLIYPSKKSKP